MGYYTDFSIRIVEGEGDIEDVAGTVDVTASYHVDVYNGAAHVNEAKWYGYEEDMRSVSAAFPDLVIEVEGSGEEYPDIWAQRFHNGEAGPRVKAVISFPGLARPQDASPTLPAATRRKQT